MIRGLRDQAPSGRSREMSVLLVDTNVVSILFNQHHRLRSACLEAVTGHELLFSFMTRAELVLWPIANNSGASRRTALEQYTELYLTLYPDDRTCANWATIVNGCRRAGQQIQTAYAGSPPRASGVVRW